MGDMWIDIATEEYENDSCQICGSEPMTPTCNNASCDTGDFDWSDSERDNDE